MERSCFQSSFLTPKNQPPWGSPPWEQLENQWQKQTSTFQEILLSIYWVPGPVPGLQNVTRWKGPEMLTVDEIGRRFRDSFRGKKSQMLCLPGAGALMSLERPRWTQSPVWRIVAGLVRGEEPEVSEGNEQKVMAEEEERRWSHSEGSPQGGAPRQEDLAMPVPSPKSPGESC